MSNIRTYYPDGKERGVTQGELTRYPEGSDNDHRAYGLILRLAEIRIEGDQRPILAYVEVGKTHE